jgi:DNA invertase Pin-like site-specific DNA recombinase
MKFGYARVSTVSQNLDMQLDALAKAGAEKVFTDKLTGTNNDRPQFMAMNDHLRRGDQVVVLKLDRLGRSMHNLIAIAENYQTRGIDIISIREDIDTSSPAGKLFFHLIAALSEFETDMISERTKEGLKAARARGRVGGRPRAMSKDEARSILDFIYAHPETAVEDVLSLFKISRSSYYRYVLPLRKEDEVAYEAKVSS